jgi:hypothetical protein
MICLLAGRQTRGGTQFFSQKWLKVIVAGLSMSELPDFGSSDVREGCGRTLIAAR